MAQEEGMRRNNNNNNNVGGGGAHVGGQGQVVLKKGPWTAAEDGILMEYVRRHGEGNWNAVQRNSGLMRCGKSCRLRWANHLRPNLKKGAFTAEEERQIIELHSKLGNKWARMALYLHGRTDNEIKNYWNTRLKRRQRAGLPIYPIDIHNHHHHHQPPLQHPNPSSSSSSSSAHHPNISFDSIPSLSIFDSFNFSSPPNYLPHPQPQHQSHIKLFRDNGCVALSLSSASNLPFSTSSSPMSFLNHGSSAFNFDMNSMPTMDEVCSFNPIGLSENMENELPLFHSSLQAVTPASSTNTGSNYMIVPSSNDVDNFEIAPELCSKGNSGLLGDLLGESQALARSQKYPHEGKLSAGYNDKGKFMQDYKLMEYPNAMNGDPIFRAGDSDNIPENHLEDSSSGYSSIGIGMKTKADVFEEMNMMDDDLSSLLDFPTALPLPDWYGGIDDTSNGISPDVTDGYVEIMNNQREVSHSPVDTTVAVEVADDHDWTLGSCCWNNMPGFC